MTAGLLLLAAASSLLPISAVAPRTPLRNTSSETALSVFREPAADRCTWLRIDPVQGRRELVAEFPLGCDGVSAAWSPDGTQGLVEFPGEWEPGVGVLRHAWLADLTTRPATLRPLPLPQAGMLDALAFDTDGFPLALFLDSPSDPTLFYARALTFV